MTPKIQKLQDLRITKMLYGHPLLDNVLLKHVTREMNMHTAVGELLEAAFSIGQQQTNVS
jgi:hypothetical protein